MTFSEVFGGNELMENVEAIGIPSPWVLPLHRPKTYPGSVHGVKGKVKGVDLTQ